MHFRRLALFVLLASLCVAAQDASTGAIRGVVTDPAAARVPAAGVTVTRAGTGVSRAVATNAEGSFEVAMLPPGAYVVRVSAAGMTAQERTILVEVGGLADVHFTLTLAGAEVSITVSEGTPLVETVPSAVSAVLDERAISDLPLNGRRFSDLALLSPGVTQDPRNLTSAANGDLAFGGMRGYHTSFLVDGADNNNGFFAQARGRYRAPYQFSNEVVQEFRVSSNTYGVELGRSGGAVINVATKSGSNHLHGTAFEYLRDSRFDATPGTLGFKPADRQHQFGFTLGGPVKKNTAFFYLGFDQHLFHVPTVVRFVDGTAAVAPTPDDYESTDQARVFAAAQQLSRMAGNYRSQLLGNTGFAKLDLRLSPSQYLSLRLSTSRYYGANNVYFDPASPITTYAIDSNGEEDVATETATASLTSALPHGISSHLRAQFSRDRQSSAANTSDVRQKIDGIIDAFGRGSILPRDTREHRFHLAETASLNLGRHSLKFGGDFAEVWIRNYFPMMFGGEYVFDPIKVNPFTFAPQVYGLALTPLRAYAHQVPRYYTQNFGTSISHPDSNDYAAFAQDTLRVTNHLAVTLGVRYDLQTFRSDGLIGNPLWPQAGRVPRDTNNVAPRLAFAYSLGDRRPVVLRGGWGMFYTRIPQIYNSAVETDNGLNQTHLFLDNADYWDRVVFPAYPTPLASCAPGATECVAPATVAGKLTSEIAAFAKDFRTPVAQQASLGVEKEVAHRFALGANYLYVHGEHLIRSRDVNLPPPVTLRYPVYSDDGSNFLNQFYSVQSFSTWQTQASLTCPFPPCLASLARPIPQVGAINEFESAASSVYHGLTVSAQRRMTRGFYFRLAYTWAHAIDDVQDALATAASAVQNSYSTASERGPSVTDQRHRLAFSWVAEPRPFHREHPVLRVLFNQWKFSGTTSMGSGRPVNARIVGDANLDGNSSNDRLPGASRNSYLGPDYATTDLRIARKFHLAERFRLELLCESFNLLNRDNRRVDTSDDSFGSSAAQFVAYNKTVGNTHYPAYFRSSGHFLVPHTAYAPRQVQFAVRLAF